MGNLGGVEAEEVPQHGRSYSVALTLPPLGVVFLQKERDLRDSKGQQGRRRKA